MAKILRQDSDDLPHYEFENRSKVDKLIYRSAAAAELEFQDGERIVSACVHCEELYCIRASQDVGVLDELDSSQSRKLCPSDAVAIDSDGRVNIERNTCVGCGLCVVSCPIGAIYLDETYVAVVEHSLDHLRAVGAPIRSREIAPPVFENQPIYESEPLIRSVIERISHSASRGQILNRLVSNALTMSGANTQLTRRGDVNLRMDGLARFENRILLVEVELSANLDAPRCVISRL